MFRFLHSADWQLGARFVRFGPKGALLRQARIETLKRALRLAQEKSVNAFMVAGDLFEDNQVEESLVREVIGIFREFASVPIYLLPGNHDPYTGPESVWMRQSFKLPSNVHLFAQPKVIELDEAVLIGVPLQQKISRNDPSLAIKGMSESVKGRPIKIGITHGALAIEGKHQPNDFPIALDAASRAGLDYLALGHWHHWLASADGGRIVMPGTPEPDGFQTGKCGCISYVEIEGAGLPPRIEAIPIGSLNWSDLSFDLHSAESSSATLQRQLSELAIRPESKVVRISITGSGSPEQIEEALGWLEKAVAPFAVGEIVDRSIVELSQAELEDLKARHPILAQVLADIEQIEQLTMGGVPPTEEGLITENEARTLLTSIKVELQNLGPVHFSRMRQILLHSLREVLT